MSVNPEDLLNKAYVAIGHWQASHEGTCYLTVIDGKVVAVSPVNYDGNVCAAGIVHRRDQHEGLTLAGWRRLRNHLIYEFERDKRCHNHRKPSP